MNRRPGTPPNIPGAEYREYLGSGGFADVYLYEQAIPTRQVAIKVTRRGVSDDARDVVRKEANMMARISSHPSIVSVYGAGATQDDRVYIVMEYCPPPNLAARVRNKPMAVDKALEIGIQMAGATETIHRAGIIHRDIKPSNILFTAFGHPVLTDFGIAQYAKDAHAEAEGFSIPWAPPEQATGEGDVTFAGDIYSLAATIYTMLAGHAPFDQADGDNSEIAMINRVLRAAVPPINRPDVPEQLERVLVTAMAKDPARRYQSALDFAHALQAVQASLHQVLTPIDVLIDDSAPEKVSDDADVTRQAVRRIDAMPVQSTLSHDRLQHEMEPSGLMGVAAEPESEQTRPRTEAGPGRSRLIALGVGAAILVAGVIGIATALGSGGGRTIEPDPTHSTGTPGAVVKEHVPPVLEPEGRVDGTDVVFEWQYPSYQDGDTFQVVETRRDDNPQEITVTMPAEGNPSVRVQLVEPRTCVEITAFRAGSPSETMNKCVDTEGEK